MVKLAFSTNAYINYSVEEALKRIAEHGYAGAELLGDTPHAYFPEFTDDDLDSVRDSLNKLDLGVSNINANTATGYYDDAPPSSFFDPTIITADDEERHWRIEYTKDAIDLAQAVDAPSICVATGRPLPGTLPEEARMYLQDSLDEILTYAEQKGVNVGIEFEPELLIESTEETLTLIQEVDRSSLGVNLDIGHAAVYGEDPIEMIHQAAGHLTGLHLEDIVGGIRGKHYHRIPGEGDLDFRGIFDALDDIGYNGYATLELYTYPQKPDVAARKAYQNLNKYL